MAFRVGQKVVCIMRPKNFPDGLANFRKGAVYTIVGFDYDDPKHPGDTYLRVAELDPSVLGHVEGFRPLTERSTEAGMTILKGILRDAKIKEPV